MPEPPKPVALLRKEGKSHRTKAELEQREAAEKAILSGLKMKELPETKRDTVARAYFKRVKKILEGIEKNDAMYEQVINRYCIMLAEEHMLREQVWITQQAIQELDEQKSEMALESYLEKRIKLTEQRLKMESQINVKRRMLLTMEKENCMTVASALRSIPKKEAKEDDPLMAILEKRNVGK